MIDSLSIAVHAFISYVSMSFLVDETLLPKTEFSSDEGFVGGCPVVFL